MVMYHRAMAPHLGGTHPPNVHPQHFPSPMYPPAIGHNYAVHSFAAAPHLAHQHHQLHQAHQSHQPHLHHQTHQNHQSHQSHTSPTSVNQTIGSSNSSMLTNPAPMLTQPSPMYSPQNPYPMGPYPSVPMGHMQSQQPTPHTHNHPHSHTHPGSIGFGHPSSMSANMPLNLHPAQQNTVGPSIGQNTGPVTSVEEDLLEEMNVLHLGYIETEDSPKKVEQRVKLENVINEYLSITPHSNKFMFYQVSDILEKSVNTTVDFTAIEAACAFDALAQYAANLLSQPWRREYREIKLYSGFWNHQVARHLVGAETILTIMGYTPVTDTSTPNREPSSPTMKLEGVLDPDLISRLALDCLIAYCECQILRKISEGVQEFGLTWKQIHQFRQLHVGSVEITVRHLLFSLRQNLQPPAQIEPIQKPAVVPSNHSVPAIHTSRSNQSQSVNVSTVSDFVPPDSCLIHDKENVDLHSSKDVQKQNLQHYKQSSLVEEITNSQNTNNSVGSHKPRLYQRENNNSHELSQSSISSANFGLPSVLQASIAPLSCTRSTDTPDTSKSISNKSGINIPGSRLGSQVPTAKLIDLDTSLDAMPSPPKPHLLPKTLPNKRASKGLSFCSSSGASLPPLEYSGHCSPPEYEHYQPPAPPPEVFRAGTLDEHLDATLSFVKGPNQSSFSAVNEQNNNGKSWESWEFVYQVLEKRGYNKDVGDRGDILHQMNFQNLHIDPINSGKKKVNEKEVGKNKPLLINQIPQHYSYDETKEHTEIPLISSSESTPLLYHGAAPDVFPNLDERNSLHENISAGFETAPSGDDYDERKSPSKELLNAMKHEKNIFASKKNNNISKLSTHSLSVESSPSRQEDPSEASRSTEIALTIHQENSNGRPPLSYSSVTKQEKPWSCATCTYVNDSKRTTCDMCAKSKSPMVEKVVVNTGGRECPQCTLINEKDAQDCIACGFNLEAPNT
ncbi:unnamed protein product, partial [Meganyctiphanes norvegica]